MGEVLRLKFLLEPKRFGQLLVSLAKSLPEYAFKLERKL